MKFAYADPPYYTKGKKHYGKFHEEAHIWDDKQVHLDLVKRLIDEYPDGWALSCNSTNLSWILIDKEIRVCAWTKTFHQIRPFSVQYAWEPVLLYGGRKGKRNPMVRDWISGHPTFRKGLPGAKPDYFNDWILSLLNYQSGDTIDDLFPGTNGMGEAVKRADERTRPL